MATIESTTRKAFGLDEQRWQRHTNRASQAVLGEGFWGNRKAVPVPAHHRIAPHVLNGLNVLGFAIVIWGLVVLDGWMVIAGLAIHMAGKNWFMDRMVWLYRDMTS